MTVKQLRDELARYDQEMEVCRKDSTGFLTGNLAVREVQNVVTMPDGIYGRYVGAPNVLVIG